MRNAHLALVLFVAAAMTTFACSQSAIGDDAAALVGPSSVTAPASNGVQFSTAVPTPSSAIVQFGRPDTGSPFPPGDEHDQSAHAKDNLTPRTVVIDAGGTVTFQVPPNVHQVAIYGPGKEVADVDVTDTTAPPAGCPPVPLIDDDELRIAAEARPCFMPWSYTQQFDTPGRYLVICTFPPHFGVGMYGWVIVRERGR
jgi:plastocyanin